MPLISHEIINKAQLVPLKCKSIKLSIQMIMEQGCQICGLPYQLLGIRYINGKYVSRVIGLAKYQACNWVGTKKFGWKVGLGGNEQGMNRIW